MSHASSHAKRGGSCRTRRRGVYLVVLAYIEFPGAVASIIKPGYQDSGRPVLLSAYQGTCSRTNGVLIPFLQSRGSRVATLLASQVPTGQHPDGDRSILCHLRSQPIERFN